MAILGVLLGITISGLVVESAFNYYFRREALGLLKQLSESNASAHVRIEALEKRRQPAAATEPEAQQKPRSGKVSMRTWNEDIGAVESK